MIFCDKENIRIEANKAPCVCARVIMPSMLQSEIEDIRKKPFLNKKDITYIITTQNQIYTIYIHKGYTWDGATIPFGFRWILGGKGNPAFLTASCIHDKMCECKWLIGYNRELSSLVFKELLLACGCNKFKAQIMYFAVNNFQKLIKGWRC